MMTACTAMLRFSPRLSTFSCVLACAHARRSRRAPAARRPDCSPRARRQARLDVDDRGVRVEQAAQVGAHGLLVRRQLGALQDDGRVHVAQPVARRAHQAHLARGARGRGARAAPRGGGRPGRRARTASRTNTSDVWPFHRGSLSGKSCPMSGWLSAPRMASAPAAARVACRLQTRPGRRGSRLPRAHL